MNYSPNFLWCNCTFDTCQCQRGVNASQSSRQITYVRGTPYGLAASPPQQERRRIFSWRRRVRECKVGRCWTDSLQKSPLHMFTRGGWLFGSYSSAYALDHVHGVCGEHCWIIGSWKLAVHSLKCPWSMRVKRCHRGINSMQAGPKTISWIAFTIQQDTCTRQAPDLNSIWGHWAWLELCLLHGRMCKAPANASQLDFGLLRYLMM